MENLKILVAQQFEKMVVELEYDGAIDTLENDQSYLLSEYRPDVFADIIEFLTDREMHEAAYALDSALLQLFFEVATSDE